MGLRNWDNYDHVGAIINYEGDDEDFGLEESLELFQYLVDTGLAWQLQGHYGRTAAGLIEQGVIARDSESEPTHEISDEGEIVERV